MVLVLIMRLEDELILLWQELLRLLLLLLLEGRLLVPLLLEVWHGRMGRAVAHLSLEVWLLHLKLLRLVEQRCLVQKRSLVEDWTLVVQWNLIEYWCLVEHWRRLVDHLLLLPWGYINQRLIQLLNLAYVHGLRSPGNEIAKVEQIGSAGLFFLEHELQRLKELWRVTH